MTEGKPCGKLVMDSDGCVSFHYFRSGWHRRVVFRIEDHKALLQDPTTKEEIEIGKIIKAPSGIVIAIFFL